MTSSRPAWAAVRLVSQKANQETSKQSSNLHGGRRWPITHPFSLLHTIPSTQAQATAPQGVSRERNCRVWGKPRGLSLFLSHL
jgi:hypothetical protein